MAYGVQLRAQSIKLSLLPRLVLLLHFLRSVAHTLPELSAPQYWCNSICCLHVPFLFVMIVYNGRQSNTLAGRLTGVLDKRFTVG